MAAPWRGDMVVEYAMRSKPGRRDQRTIDYPRHIGAGYPPGIPGRLSGKIAGGSAGGIAARTRPPPRDGTRREVTWMRWRRAIARGALRHSKSTQPAHGSRTVTAWNGRDRPRHTTLARTRQPAVTRVSSASRSRLADSASPRARYSKVPAARPRSDTTI